MRCAKDGLVRGLFVRGRRSQVLLMLLMLLAAPAARSDLTVIMLANEGVLLDDGKTRIMIDGFVVEPYSIYGGLPPAAAAQFDRLEGDFGDIDAALAS